MKKIILSALMALALIGCGETEVTSVGDRTIIGDKLAEPDVNNGSGSYKADISSNGGLVEVEYLIRDQDEVDTDSFFITHYINGSSYDHYFPSTFSNGSIMRVEAKVYIPENDSGGLNVHIIEVSYFADNINKVDIFAISQKSIEDNANDAIIFSACASGSCSI